MDRGAVKRWRLAVAVSTFVVVALSCLPAASPAAAAPSALPPVDSPYAIGRPVLKTIWVDPRAGSDGRSGASRSQALRTLDAAWQRIPQGKTLTRTGYRIMITRGSLAPTAVPNYFESRYGTARFPILIQSADGAGSVTLPAVNIFDTRYLYFVGLTFSSRLGDAVHCEKCDHFLLRGNTVRGAPRESGEIGDLVKINQSQYVFLESNDISGASDNAVDFVAVQHGAMLSNRIHDAGDWCAYAKGGSAYLRVSGNEFYDCGTGGFTAGQGTGFQFMSVPWLQYEAYGITITNNVVHDAEGAGFGVNGGYNVLIAYNTMYRIGTRDHLLEFVAGHRSCDGVPGDEGRDRCAAYLARGGWGTTRVDDGENYVRIPNRHVFVYDNVILNPSGMASAWMQIAVAAPYSGASQNGSNVAAPTRFDDDLRIVGNVIWDGPADHASGLGGEDAGCRDSNPTCNEDQYRADNAVNTVRPDLAGPAAGNYALTPSSAAALATRTAAIPAFSWSDAPAGTPAGTTTNSVPRDRSGAPRGARSAPGAYAG